MGDVRSIDLARLDTCTVADALDRVLGSAAPDMVAGIVPMSPVTRVAGWVRTMRLEPAPPDAPPPAAHLGTSVISRSVPGDVIVVEHHSRPDASGWGGLLSLAASLRGVTAVIVDGACRDVDDAISIGLPLFARSATARTARGRVVETSSGEPVTIGGVPVAEGDLVVADNSGIVFVRSAVVVDVLAVADEIADREAAMGSRLREGADVVKVLGGDYEMMTRARADT